MKDAFFDSKKVIAALDKSTRKAMIKSSAAVRRQMRSQLVRRNRASRPGEAPSVHSTSAMASLRAIFFAYDERTKLSVVGPIKLPGSSSSVPLPGLLEHGGTVVVKPSRRRSGGSRRGGVRRSQRVKIAARPNAGPALKKSAESGEILSPWAHVVQG